MKRYALLIGVIILLPVFIIFQISNNSTIPNDELLSHMTSGGPPPDGIPSIDEPEFEVVADVRFLEDDDQVFVLELEDTTYIYPQKILVWHEIVNMVDLDICITYCPLTASAITYEIPNDSTFGTSGSLINSNLLMYDRETDSYISQIHGVGLNEELEGVILDTIPTFWATWKDAKHVYPEALVLRTKTGYLRDYNDDPYGSYTADVNNNYYFNDRLLFELINTDENSIFGVKEMIVGVKNKNKFLAIDPELVKERTYLVFELGGDTFTAIYDTSIKSVRVFSGEYTYNEGALMLGEEKIDLNNQLVAPTYFEVMWFAWYAFYPESDILK